MEGHENVSLGLVYFQDGLVYYSVLPAKDAQRYEQLVISRGCIISTVYILATTEELRAFIEMEQDYRLNVWAHLPTQKIH